MLISFRKIIFLIKDNPILSIFYLVFYFTIIYLAFTLNIWEDELYSLNTSSKSLSYAFNQSLVFEAQPPAYFISLTLWRSVSNSIIWARLFSVLIIFLSQIVLFLVIREVADKKIAKIFSVLFLLNPIVIFSILEIRLYSLIILLTLLILYKFFNSYYRNKVTYVGRSVFVIISIFGVFTQFFIGFILFANAIVLLFEKKYRELKIYILDMALPLFLLLLFIPYIRSSIGLHDSLLPPENYTLIEFSTLIAKLFMLKTYNYLLPFDFELPGIIYWVFRIGIIILFLLSLDVSYYRSIVKRMLPFIILSLVIYLFFTVVYFLFGTSYSQNKYSLVLFVPLFVSLAIIFKYIKSSYLYVWIVLFAALYLVNSIRQFPGLYKHKDYKSVCMYIYNHDENGKPVFAFRNVSAEILNLYYKGNTTVYPIPDKFSYTDEFSSRQWTIESNDLEKLSKIISQDSSFYVIIDDSPLSGFKESKSKLKMYLQKSFELEKEISFGNELFLYEYTTKK